MSWGNNRQTFCNNKVCSPYIRAEKVLRNNHLTLAGLLFFGKEPQTLCPAFIIKVAMFAGNDIGGNVYRSKPENLTGPIPELFRQGMMYLKSNIRYLQNGQRFNSHGIPEVSIIAMKKVFRNALVHCNYFENSSVRPLAFDNGIEIISPGKLSNNLTVEEVKYGNPVIRNNQIALFASQTFH